MDISFIKGCENVNFGGDVNFNLKQGPDYSHTTNTRKTIVNDRSRHTSNYGSYTNYGQHADGGGQINNYGAQTTNHGPIHGYQQFTGNNVPRYTPNIPNRPPFSDDDVADEYQPPPRAPYRSAPGSRDYNGRNPAAMRTQRRNTTAPQEPKIPRRAERPNRPSDEFDQNSPDFQREYETMSPRMKSLLQGRGFGGDRQDSLNQGMANLGLGEPARQRPRRSQTEVASKGLTPRPFTADSDEEEDTEDDAEDDDSDDDEGFATGNRQPYQPTSTSTSTSYIHNDNRVITKNVNSHNVNTENIIDSYNDNATRTEINKTRSP